MLAEAEMCLKTGRRWAVHGAWLCALHCAGFGPETSVCRECAGADLTCRSPTERPALRGWYDAEISQELRNLSGNQLVSEKQGDIGSSQS